MAWNSCNISAPGSVMILGEHAVLHGSRAIVCAVNHRMTFIASPCDLPVLKIKSDLGQYESPLDSLKENHTFRFVLEAFKGLDSDKGIDLTIHSEMSDQVGLGTSAAVTACACALRAWIESGDTRPDAILNKTVNVIRTAQGSGSGSDAAATIFGGCVAYDAETLDVTPLTLENELALIYAGYKRSTPEVLNIVNTWAKDHPDEATDIYSDMKHSVDRAALSLQQGDNPAFLETVRKYQLAMKRLGVCDEILASILRGLSTQPGVTAAKISGSGLGDCVIAFGDAKARIEGYTTIEIAIDPKGLHIEPI